MEKVADQLNVECAKKSKCEKFLALHIIADLYQCQSGTLEKSSCGKKILQKAVEESGLAVVSINSHQFAPAGYTASAVLKESHISIHTWPELGTVLLDIFTCGDEKKGFAAFAALVQAFAPKKISKKVLHRGFLDNSDQ